MNKIYYFLLLLLLSTNVGCQDDTEKEGYVRTVKFTISPTYEIEETEGTRSISDEVITHLWYTVFDKNGKTIEPPHQLLTPDLSKIVIEGLRDGEYSIAILATTGDEVACAIPTLSSAEEEWLRNQDADSPLDQNYLYRRYFFTVGKDNNQHNILIQLERSVGLVKVNISTENSYTKHFIRNVEFSLDEQSSLYLSQLGEGAYSGKGSIKEYDITETLCFYSLPGQSKLSGTVKITSILSDSTTIITATHFFSELEIEPGKVSTINIDYKHPEANKGSFRVKESDYTPQNSTLMLQDDEPNSVFTNESLRNFRVNAPLKVSINADKELQLQFYSAIPIQNVKILCKFNKYSNEYVELAHYDKIPAFHESRMALPITKRSSTFRSIDGRNIVIPALPNLVDNDCSFRIQTDDPYMAKIATINPRWYIRFSNYSANPGNSNNWRYMTPYYCREACAVSTNMAFLFSHSEFEAELLLWEGKLHDDGKNIIPLQTIRDKILNHPGLMMGLVGNVGGLGGGETYGLAPYVYELIYADAEDGVHTYSRMAAFHEFGHCIGYGHESNMTYGDAWTVLCANVFVRLCNSRTLPIYSKTILRPHLAP